MVDENNKEIEICPNCNGIGYKHITGILEVLEINDAIREALVKSPKLDRIMALAKANRHVAMRDMGIVAAAQSVTSIEEVQRMLKK